MSFRYPAGLITASSPVNANYPSGVWTPRQALPYLQNNVWGQDPFFDQTVLLLHGDGTNGAQNNTFLDSSSNNFTITRNGNTTQGTFSPFSLAAGEWSNYFDGTGDRLTAPANAAFQPGTGDFSLEAFFYSQTTAVAGLCGTNYTGASPNTYVVITINRDAAGSNIPGFLTGGISDSAGNSITTSSSVFSNNTWNHVVFCRTGSTLSLFINGSRVGSITNTTNITPNIQFEVGDTSALTRPFAGYISNVRFIKGSHPYNATQTTYTVPTTPLTAITNTSLLTCQSNRFVDNSTNNFAITRNGDVRVTPFSPFQPLLAYSPGVTGGSGYFDGSGDYLQYASNVAFEFGTGNFTIEFWWYPQNLSATQPLIYHTNDSGVVGTGEFVIVYSTSLGLRFYINSGATTIDQGSTSGWSTNQWYHITAVRNGNTLTLYRNGVSIASGSVTGVTIGAAVVTQVGGESYDPLYSTGYISSYRVVKGTAVYTAAFTPPTAPVTAISGTSLLLNFTNAGILDNTAKNVLETVGNAQVDTSVVKYGTGSMEFDGTGDYLLGPYNPDFNFDTGDFTIECWIYLNSIPVNDYRQIVCFGTSSSSQRWILLYDTRTITSAPHLAFYSLNSSNAVTVEVKGGGSSGWSANTWYHVAITRQGTSFKLFRDGVQNGSTVTDSDPVPGTVSTGSLFVGAEVGGSLAYWNGYIDDLRITKGIARYTANFVPPIARFPNQ